MSDDGSIFTASFTRALATETEGSAGATSEAETAGPWEVLASGLGWSVGTQADAGVEVLTGDHELALLVAAALPGTGREPFFRLVETRGEHGFPLLAADGAPAGHIRHFNQRLAEALHTLECLRRDPLSLARFLHAARTTALDRAGRYLWLWEQAPPRP